VTPDRLSLRELNRTTLERQLLLRRAALAAGPAIGHLAGLQAQAPLAPYVGLWTRLAGFRPPWLSTLMTERTVVRAHLMRNTVHLVTAEDFIRFRPLVQPLMERGLAGNFGPRLIGIDLAELREQAAALLAQSTLTRVELARRLAPRWPDHDPAALAYAATHLVPLVQVPPRGLWGESGQARFFLASAWLEGNGRAEEPGDAVEQLVLRYLAAYGPARVADVQAWSGLSRLREVTERLGARLRAFTGPDGGLLLDLADAPRATDPGLPAPPRFLPEYDNLLLSFAERSRVIPHRRPVPLPPGNGAAGGTLLIDGFWQADWKITRSSAAKGRGETILTIQPFIRLSPAGQAAIAAEGERLLEFAAPEGTGRDVRFARVAE
jgi:Winged helix DNA-binding domain